MSERLVPMITADEIRARTAELGKQLTEDYKDKSLVLVSVLKGSFIFAADLMRAIDLPCRIDFLGVRSYGAGTETSGVVQITNDLSRPIDGADVLIVEDIVDTGLTLSYLVQNLQSRGPASVEVLTMFRKPDAMTAAVAVKYVGFDIPNEFVVGYGLDYAGRYRNLTDVATLAPHIYT